MNIDKQMVVGPTDTDSYNIIHHPQYFIWIEEAILEWIVSAYGGLQDLSYEISHFQCKFISPGLLYDNLKLQLIPKNKRTDGDSDKVRFQVRIMNQEQKKTVIEADFTVSINHNAASRYILVGAAMFNWCETQRMIEIADELNHRGYRIVFIGEGKYDHLLTGKDYIREHIDYDKEWYTPKRISMMLGMDRYGSSYASLDEIEKIVEAETRVIKKYKPAAILTGYRMSLTVSARVCRVPVIWSLAATISRPYLEGVYDRIRNTGRLRKDSGASYLEMRGMIEDKIACERLLNECKTLTVWNTFLKNNGCEPFTSDLDIYTGDLNLMSDSRMLFSDIKETDKHRFIGPILNNQHIDMPEIVDRVVERSDKKRILVSIGTAGKKEMLLKILKATAGLDHEFFISVLGVLTEEEIESFPDNYHFCEKFPLIEIAELCDAAVIQGGQGTLYAMLAGQCPFVSLPGSFEQRQNVENLLKNFRCGEIVRNFGQSEADIRRLITDVLTKSEYKDAIKKAAEAVGDGLTNRKMASILAADHIEDFLREKEGAVGSRTSAVEKAGSEIRSKDEESIVDKRQSKGKAEQYA